MARQRIDTVQASYVKTLESLQEIRQFAGTPAQFWPMFLDALLRMSGTKRGIVTVGNDGTGSWKVISSVPSSTSSTSANYDRALRESADECLSNGSSSVSVDGKVYLLISLQTGVATDRCVAAVELDNPTKSQTEEAIRRASLIRDVPASYQLQRVATEARTRVEHFASVLDLMILVNGEKRFLATAMTFCNELASRHSCERVSVGWLEKDYIRLKAMSHADKFEKKAEAILRLEQTMEEALDQNAEIVYPGRGAGVIAHDHEAFSKAYDVEHICSLPIRVDDQPVAVCTCERNENPFTELEIRLLRLSCDQAATRLADLKRNDRWFGARLVASLRERLAKLVGFEHTWAKLLAILIVGLLGFVIFGSAEYRVSAPLIIRTEDVVYLTAPFDGHIYDVAVRVGDDVEVDTTLLSLDQNDLRLQESALIAEYNRYKREFDKARASNELADVRINDALLEQTQARLDLVRYQLGQSDVKAPFSGIVVEGDQIERIGAPVRQGDTLFRLAQIENLFAEIEVSESEIHELNNSRQGWFALASRPEDRYPIVVFRIEPEAVPKEKGSVFVVQCDFINDTPDWWRPGMTGIAKIETGKRPIWWVLSHKTIEFIRLRFWW